MQGNWLKKPRYRSDFSAKESFIDKASNNQYSPTLSNSSMLLFIDNY